MWLLSLKRQEPWRCFFSDSWICMSWDSLLSPLSLADFQFHSFSLGSTAHANAWVHELKCLYWKFIFDPRNPRWTLCAFWPHILCWRSYATAYTWVTCFYFVSYSGILQTLKRFINVMRSSKMSRKSKKSIFTFLAFSIRVLRRL